MAEYQLEKEKERLKEIQIKLSEEQASFKAEHDQLIVSDKMLFYIMKSNSKQLGTISIIECTSSNIRLYI